MSLTLSLSVSPLLPVGACSLIQAVVPRVLLPAPGSRDESSLRSFHDHYLNVLSSNANICFEECSKSPYLTPVLARGAMYCMVEVKIDALNGFTDDRDFSAQLLLEENVFVLPGQCFGMKNYFRLVTCPPSLILTEAIERIREFCFRHRKDDGSSGAAATG
jgi:tyrosine aminotransferase